MIQIKVFIFVETVRIKVVKIMKHNSFFRELMYRENLGSDNLRKLQKSSKSKKISDLSNGIRR